jgi:cell division transport system ATP-binding protein
MPLLKFDNVSKIYPGGTAALASQLRGRAGEMLFVTGTPAPARAPCSADPPERAAERGTVLVAERNLRQVRGRQVASTAPGRRVHQDHRLLMERSVFDNVALPLLIAGVPGARVGKRVRSMLDKVGLARARSARRANCPPASSSAWASPARWSAQPLLLLADEPTGNLDPTLAARSCSCSRAAGAGHRGAGRQPRPGLVKRMRKRVLVLDHGRLTDDIARGSGRVTRPHDAPRSRRRAPASGFGSASAPGARSTLLAGLQPRPLLPAPFATLLTVGVMAMAIACRLARAGAGNLQRLSGSLQASREIGLFLRMDVDAAQAERLATNCARAATSPRWRCARRRRAARIPPAQRPGRGAGDAGDNPLPTCCRSRRCDDGAALAAQMRARPEVELVQHDDELAPRLDRLAAFGRRWSLVLAACSAGRAAGGRQHHPPGDRQPPRGDRGAAAARRHRWLHSPAIHLPGAWYGLAAGLPRSACWRWRPAAAAEPGCPRGQLRQPLRAAGPGPCCAGMLLLAATAARLAGAWLASGHHLRQTRPTDL